VFRGDYEYLPAAARSLPSMRAVAHDATPGGEGMTDSPSSRACPADIRACPLAEDRGLESAQIPRYPSTGVAELDWTEGLLYPLWQTPLVRRPAYRRGRRVHAQHELWR
jgi:hypothetical protein